MRLRHALPGFQLQVVSRESDAGSTRRRASVAETPAGASAWDDATVTETVMPRDDREDRQGPVRLLETDAWPSPSTISDTGAKDMRVLPQENPIGAASETTAFCRVAGKPRPRVAELLRFLQFPRGIPADGRP